jgi:hypothetical protein
LIYNGTSYPEIIYKNISGLTTGLSYTFNLYSMNAIYLSALPDTETIMIGTVPTQTGKPTLISSDNTLLTITVGWTAPIDNGGNEITNYYLWIDDGAGTFTVAPSID